MDLSNEYMVELQDANNEPILARYFRADSDEAARCIFRQFLISDIGRHMAATPGAGRWDMFLLPAGLHPIRAEILKSVPL